MQEFISGSTKLPSDARPCELIQSTYYAIQMYSDFTVDGEEFHTLDYLLYEPSNEEGKIGRYAGYPEYLFNQHYKWVKPQETKEEKEKKSERAQLCEQNTQRLIEYFTTTIKAVEKKAQEDAKQSSEYLLDMIDRYSKINDVIHPFIHSMSGNTGIIFEVSPATSVGHKDNSDWEFIDNLNKNWFCKDTTIPDYSRFFTKAMKELGFSLSITNIKKNSAIYRVTLIIDVPEYKRAPIEVSAFNADHEAIDFSKIAASCRK